MLRNISDIERDAILAALWLLEESINGQSKPLAADVRDIYLNGRDKGLQPDDIADLRERVNDGETRPKLVVSIEGGCLTGVSSDQPDAFDGIDITVVDYDVECADETVLSTIKNTFDGSTEQAQILRPGSVGKLAIELPVPGSCILNVDGKLMNSDGRTLADRAGM